MYVIAGLGNPGRQYERTRHNMGFLTVDEFAAAHGIDVRRIKHKALIGEGRIAGEKVLLVKPQTYMNLSGESLREVMRYYDVPIENLIVMNGRTMSQDRSRTRKRRYWPKRSGRRLPQSIASSPMESTSP